MKRVFLRLLLFLCAVSVADAQMLTVSTRAKAAVLINPDNGAILYEKHAHQPHYPASLTKVVTALFLLEQLNPSLTTQCLASKEALTQVNAEVRQADVSKYPPHILEHDGVMMGLKAGESYCLETLLYALLLNSSNDAANVLAETSAGSIPSFMEGVNRYLQEKGMVHSHFQNPHGLYHPAQLITAYEMAKIAGLAFSNPLFAKVAQTSTYQDDPIKSFTTYNRLMKEGKYRYPKAIGGKTGYTASAGFNMVAAAEEGGRRLIAVVLGCKSSDERYEDVIALFEAAFAEKKEKRLLFAHEGSSFQREIEGKILKAGLKNQVEIDYFPSEEGRMEAQIEWFHKTLPIAVGEQVGELRVLNEHACLLAASPLFALDEVRQNRSLLMTGVITGLVAVFLCGLYFLQRLAMAKKRRKLF